MYIRSDEAADRIFRSDSRTDSSYGIVEFRKKGRYSTGMKFHWTQHGDPGGEAIVFLHGFLGSSIDFKELVKVLAPRFQSFVPDLPGHGKSHFDPVGADEAEMSFYDVASSVLEQLTAQGVDDFVLYGYSMGGRVAQAMCLQAPGRIKHLVLESASFGIRNEIERRMRYEKDQLLLSGVTTTVEFYRFLEKWHRLPLFSTLAGTALLDELIVSKQRNDIRQLERALKVLSVGNQPCFMPELNEIDIPITFFYGDQDEKYKQLAHEAKEFIPRMSLRGFEKASHNIHVQFLPQIVLALHETLL